MHLSFMSFVSFVVILCAINVAKAFNPSYLRTSFNPSLRLLSDTIDAVDNNVDNSPNVADDVGEEINEQIKINKLINEQINGQIDEQIYLTGDLPNNPNNKKRISTPFIPPPPHVQLRQHKSSKKTPIIAVVGRPNVGKSGNINLQ